MKSLALTLTTLACGGDPEAPSLEIQAESSCQEALRQASLPRARTACASLSSSSPWQRFSLELAELEAQLARSREAELQMLSRGTSRALQEGQLGPLLSLLAWAPEEAQPFLESLIAPDSPLTAAGRAALAEFMASHPQSQSAERSSWLRRRQDALQALRLHPAKLPETLARYAGMDSSIACRAWAQIRAEHHSEVDPDRSAAQGWRRLERLPEATLGALSSPPPSWPRTLRGCEALEAAEAVALSLAWACAAAAAACAFSSATRALSASSAAFTSAHAARTEGCAPQDGRTDHA